MGSQFPEAFADQLCVVEIPLRAANKIDGVEMNGKTLAVDGS